MSNRAKRPLAFTLIELLVVMSIVGILIATLMPAIGKARDSAKTSICMSNQRQLAVLNTYYLNDQKQFFPASWDGNFTAPCFWFEKYAAYFNLKLPGGYDGVIGNAKGVEKIFLCPASTKNVTFIDRDNTGYGWNFHGLTFLDDTAVYYAGQTAKIDQVQQPSDTIMTGDSWEPSAGPTYVITYGGGTYAPLNRHNSKANYLMVDSHVSLLAPDVASIPITPYWYMKK